MQFIIYLKTSSRRSIPRVGNFIFNEAYQRYLYLGRPLEAHELNAAAAAVMDEPVRNLGHHVTIRLVNEAHTEIPASVNADKTTTETEEKQEEIVPVTEEEKQEEETSPDTETSPSPFTIINGEIFKDGEKIAGFTDPENHLRMTRGNAALREELEAWLSTNQ